MDQPQDLVGEYYPFNHLSLKRRHSLSAACEKIEYSPSQLIINHKSPPGAVFIIISGSVVHQQNDLDAPRHPDEIEAKPVLASSKVEIGPGSYFGEREVLFEMPYRRDWLAGAHGAVVYEIPGADFLQAVAANENRFTLSLADSLKNKQLIFEDFHEFRKAITPQDNQVDFKNLLRAYRNLKPALHVGIDSAVIDCDALKYAIPRLPTNITNTFSLVMSRKFIAVLEAQNLQSNRELSNSSHMQQNSSNNTAEDADYLLGLTIGIPVLTAARRRTCRELMPGKLFVLIREGTEDFIDFLTVLCILTLEMEKLRRRLSPLSDVFPLLVKSVHKIKTGVADPMFVQKEVFDHLINIGRLSQQEVADLSTVWPKPGDPIIEIYQSILHHGDYRIYVDSDPHNYSVLSSEKWINRVRKHSIEAIGTIDNDDVRCQPLCVDIISSNTHSIYNCISPYIHIHRNEIFDWGKVNDPETFNENLLHDDIVYVVSRKYFEAFPEKAKEKEKVDKEAGITSIPEKEFTGISVQIIDVVKLKNSTYVQKNPDGTHIVECDTSLEGIINHKPLDGMRHLIVNIDYAFGSQAGRILKLLLMLFGNAVRSVNILGKAGAVIGSRGDILYPTHITSEGDSEFLTVDNEDVTLEEIQQMCKSRDIHIGPMLTVEGTLIQNRSLLLFYKRLMNITGMEMEGKHYLQSLLRCKALGIVNRDIKKRFLYYVSDTPLKASKESLATKMTLDEGITPLYAISRIFLRQVLKNPERNYSKPCKLTLKAVAETVGLVRRYSMINQDLVREAENEPEQMSIRLEDL